MDNNLKSSPEIPKLLNLDPSSLSDKFCSRKTYSLDFKVQALGQAQEWKAMGRGHLKKFLDKSGLRSSHLTEWKKQLAAGQLGIAKRGRPRKSLGTMAMQIRTKNRQLEGLEKRLQECEIIIQQQRKYILATDLRKERKDRGLLSQLIAQVESLVSISSACQAFGLARKDFYHTIKPIRRQPYPENQG